MQELPGPTLPQPILYGLLCLLARLCFAMSTKSQKKFLGPPPWPNPGSATGHVTFIFACACSHSIEAYLKGQDHLKVKSLWCQGHIKVKLKNSMFLFILKTERMLCRWCAFEGNAFLWYLFWQTFNWAKYLYYHTATVILLDFHQASNCCVLTIGFFQIKLKWLCPIAAGILYWNKTNEMNDTFFCGIRDTVHWSNCLIGDIKHLTKAQPMTKIKWSKSDQGTKQ